MTCVFAPFLNHILFISRKYYISKKQRGVTMNDLQRDGRGDEIKLNS